VIADCAAFVGNESEPPFTRTKARSTYTVSLIARQSETREGCRKKKGERERKKGLVCEAINRVRLMRRRTCYSNRMLLVRGNANSLLNASVEERNGLSLIVFAGEQQDPTIPPRPRRNSRHLPRVRCSSTFFLRGDGVDFVRCTSAKRRSRDASRF